MRARASTNPQKRPMSTSRAAPRPRRRRSAGGASVPTPITCSSAALPARRPPVFPVAGAFAAPAPPGESIDLRRRARLAVRQGGDTPELPWRRRRSRHRRILLLIDISGSMKEHTEHTLRFAHALYRAAERMECFTLGTRLTRVTGAFRLRNPDRALVRASALAPDWDGGTRIGDALRAFLSVPRFAGLARGAAVVVLSDGLERGAPDAMVEAVQRLLPARVAPELAHAARGRCGLPSRDRSARRDPALARRPRGRRVSGTPGRPRARARSGSGAGKRPAPSRSSPRALRRREDAGPRESATVKGISIVDAHHHVWRRADLPWLSGPMRPRIFGPYEAIRRDYPMDEFLADIAGTGVTRSVYVQANWAPERFEDEVAWVEQVADESGWPHAIVGYADLLAEECAPPARPARALPAPTRRAHADPLARERDVPLCTAT